MSLCLPQGCACKGRSLDFADHVNGKSGANAMELSLQNVAAVSGGSQAGLTFSLLRLDDADAPRRGLPLRPLNGPPVATGYLPSGIPARPGER
jgi:hypothetical protein